MAMDLSKNDEHRFADWVLRYVPLRKAPILITFLETIHVPSAVGALRELAEARWPQDYASRSNVNIAKSD